MEKIRLELLGLSSSQSQIGSYALVLAEEGGTRRLPIIIGAFEAQAIALEIENIKPDRPMTHDLFTSVMRAFSIEVSEVVISDLKEGVFFGKLICQNGKQTLEIDARPSDAIAIAVRFRVPIFTYEFILGEAGIIVKEQEGEEHEAEETTKRTPKKTPKQEAAPISKLDKMRADLKKALEVEDYEKAAKLRDEIKKLEDKNK